MRTAINVIYDIEFEAKLYSWQQTFLHACATGSKVALALSAVLVGQKSTSTNLMVPAPAVLMSSLRFLRVPLGSL